MQMVKTLVRMGAGLGITFAGLGAVGAFGVFAFVGMPMLAVGLGLVSSAIADL